MSTVLKKYGAMREGSFQNIPFLKKIPKQQITNMDILHFWTDSNVFHIKVTILRLKYRGIDCIIKKW